MQEVITVNLDLWTSVLLTKTGAARGSNGKLEAYGVRKLRELILELAANGVLVDEEPASPAKRARIGEIAELVMGQAPPGSDCNKDGVGTVFVKTGEFGDLYPEEVEWTTNPLKLARKGDVLICVVGATVGKLNLGIDCAIGRSVAAIRPTGNVETKYLYFALMPYTLALRSLSRGSAQGVIGKAELRSVEIRLPSIEEQRRIVAKVDELMTVCDQLEQQQVQNFGAHQTLVKSLLATLTHAVSRQELTEAWERVTDHFDTLFTTEGSVDELEQAILQLAVMGKLVSQDPRDEPADSVVQRIHKENEATKNEGKLTEVPPFDLPRGWTIAKLGSILSPQRGISYGVIKLGGEPAIGGVYILRCSNVRFREIDLTGVRRITEDLSGEYARTILQGGEILINVRGTLGGCAVVPKSMKGFNIAREVAVVPVHAMFNSEYLLNVVSAPYFQNKVNESLRGIAYEGLNLGLLREFVVPIPPLAEQQRIAARVGELMALCDALRARLADAQTTQIHLADAIVEQAVA